MKLITVTLPSNHNMFHFGDLHDSSVLSSTSGWNKLVDLMHSEYDGCRNNYGIDGGDMIEAIMVDDPRTDEEKLKEALPLAQIREAKRKREPIKDKLITILMGNHERKLWRFGNITQEVCEHLGVEYGTYTAKIIIQDNKDNLMYKTYETHGFKNITSTADDPLRRRVNMNLILKRHLKFKAGDCAIMIKHHSHKLLVCVPESELYMTDDNKKIKQAYTMPGQNEPYIHPDARWYGNAGSFLRLYGENISGYAEIMELDPVELGFLVTKVRDRKIVEVKAHYLALK